MFVHLQRSSKIELIEQIDTPVTAIAALHACLRLTFRELDIERRPVLVLTVCRNDCRPGKGRGTNFPAS